MRCAANQKRGALVDLSILTTRIPVDQLHAKFRDFGITPARLIAIGFDVRPGPQRQPGLVEVQRLTAHRGETPQRLVTLDVEHHPGFAYLWNIQSRHGRSVVEGDADLSRVIHTPEFARAHNALLGLIRNGNAPAHGDIFLVGSGARPQTWDASGRAYAPLFGEDSRRAFLRLRRQDILWAEGNRLVAAPADALAVADRYTDTRSIFAAAAEISMLSKVHGRMGHHIVVTAGREFVELDLGENAADPMNRMVVSRKMTSTGLFIGHADPGRGLKALVSLEMGTKGGWQLAIYPLAAPPDARELATERRA